MIRSEVKNDYYQKNAATKKKTDAKTGRKSSKKPQKTKRK
jgi:hypothetical protein